ncbi:serpin B3-like [Brevipalpus obovatus]|uniref:serpin B3-like n=1 Tax=Brevipalpus obovatus TaxID=246614 RepID=UPI003D9E5FC1
MLITISVTHNLCISLCLITILSSSIVHGQDSNHEIVLENSPLNNSELTSTIINSAKNNDENGHNSESIGISPSSMIEKESELIPSSSPTPSPSFPSSSDASPISMDPYPSLFAPPKGYSTSLKMASDRFTLASLRLLASRTQDNILMSPFGVLMTYASLLRGASDSAQHDLKSLLDLTQFSDINSIQTEFGQLLRKYGKSRDQYTLNIGTKTILNEKNIIPEFSEAVSAYFNTLTSSESFADQSTVQKLNEWILRMTNGTGSTYDNLPVKDDPNVGMLMMNSVYFKGQWMKPFDRTFTRDIFFKNDDGTTSNIKQMMMNFAQFPFAELYELKTKIIELPYHGNISMIIIMPDDIVKGLNRTLNTLTEETIDKYIASLFPTELNSIGIPKFMLKDSRTFDDIRPEIGRFFSDKSGMSKLSSDLIGRPTARQQTSIMVDEEGSSVSASFESLGGSYPIQHFILDRPFMFLIRDKSAQINLFAGIVRKMESY